MQNLKLAIPTSQAFFDGKNDFLPLCDALSFKNPNQNHSYNGKKLFLESSINVGSSTFLEELKTQGYLAALKTGAFESFACDIGPNCSWELFQSKNGFGRSKPTSEMMSEGKYLHQAKENTKALRSLYSGRIQVENLNYFSTGAYEMVCEADFVHRLVDVCDIDLLLDMGHAMICAHNLKYDSWQSYFKALPLQRVIEIQVSHAGMLNGEFEDLHERPTDKEYEALDFLMPELKHVKYITLEYYKDKDLLLQSYQRLNQWTKAFQSGLSGLSAGMSQK